MTEENENIQKCWYCKKNKANYDFTNIQVKDRSHYKINGFTKTYVNKKSENKIVRCENCHLIHSKGNKIIGFTFLFTYMTSYYLLCKYLLLSNNFNYIIFIFLAGIPSLITYKMSEFLIGTFFSKKYNIKPSWARKGFL